MIDKGLTPDVAPLRHCRLNNWFSTLSAVLGRAKRCVVLVGLAQKRHAWIHEKERLVRKPKTAGSFGEQC